MVKRFVETVSIVPQSVSTGAAQAQLSLADRLESFKQSVRSLEVQIGTRLGQEEAAQVPIETIEGEVQAPKFRDPSIGDILLTGGARRKAYNQTLRDGYLASLENDIRLDLSKIEIENPDNLIPYNTSVEGYKKGVLGGVDPSARLAVQKFIDSQIGDARVRVQRKALFRAEKEAVSSIEGAITSSSNEAFVKAREGNKEGATNALLDAFAQIDGLVENGQIDSDKGAARKREIEREATEQGFRFQLDVQADTEGMEAAFAELEKMSNRVPKGWTPDEWDTFIGTEQADLNAKQARILKSESEISLDTSREISNLKIQASTGTGEPSQILTRTEELFNEGIISEPTRTSIITNVINAQKSTVQDAASRQAVAARLNGNPEIVVTQADVDFVWNESIAPIVAEMPTGQRNAAIAQFVEETKRIPTQTKNQITSNLNSFDTELIVESADLMDRLDSIRGIPEDNFSPNERAFAENIVILSQNLTPEEAVRLVRKNTDPNDAARVEMRTSIIKEEKWQDDYNEWINDAFDPFFGRTRIDPINEGKLTKEFGVLFEEHFKAGMDEDAAREKSLQILQRNWGETNITGKPRAIKYPPEDYYTVGGNSEYMGDQLITEISSENIFDRPVTKEMVLVVSDEQTARDAIAGVPTYSIILNLGEEGLLPLTGVRWAPDVNAEIQRQKTIQEKRTIKLRKQ